MIIGNGDIGSILGKATKPKDDKFIFFASGVSNSAETRDSEFMREVNLLDRQDHSKHIVYFSSISIFWSDTPYFKHKKFMESKVALDFNSYTIVRLGNITWGKNSHTLINFFRNKIKNNESIEIQPGYRYIVTEEEFLYWIDLIPDWNCEFTIPGKRMRIIDIAKEYGYA